MFLVSNELLNEVYYAQTRLNEVCNALTSLNQVVYLVRGAMPTNEVQTRLQRGPNEVLRNGLMHQLNAITF